MKHLLTFFVAGCIVLLFFAFYPAQKAVSLFDGKSFNGWEGDTLKTWRIENGAIVGGSLTSKVPHNDFLCTKRDYGNFVLKLKFKLTGTEGFINSGVQFRSRKLTNPAYEMKGYQADLGANYWASLYDESRRNKTLIAPDSMLIKKTLKPNDWNDYEVSAINRRIRLKLNGKLTIDYTEKDENIPQTGIIGLQIHGGGKAEAAFKDITIQALK